MLNIKKEKVKEYVRLASLDCLDNEQRKRFENLSAEARADDILQLCFEICDDYLISAQPSEFEGEYQNLAAMLR